MSAPFRLLDLTQELIDKIFDCYFEESGPFIHCRNGFYQNDPREDGLYYPLEVMIKDCPNLNVLRTSRRILRDCEAAMSRNLYDYLYIHILFIDPDLFYSAFRKIAECREYRLMRNSARTIEIDDGGMLSGIDNIDWAGSLTSVPKLCQLVLQGSVYERLDWDSFNELIKRLEDESFPIATIVSDKLSNLEKVKPIAQVMEQQMEQNCRVVCRAQYVASAVKPSTLKLCDLIQCLQFDILFHVTADNYSVVTREVILTEGTARKLGNGPPLSEDPRSFEAESREEKAIFIVEGDATHILRVIRRNGDQLEEIPVPDDGLTTFQLDMVFD